MAQAQQGEAFDPGPFTSYIPVRDPSAPAEQSSAGQKGADGANGTKNGHNGNGNGNGSFTSPKIYSPPVRFEQKGYFTLDANIGGYTQTLYSPEDLVRWSRSTNDPRNGLVRGEIGERLLSLTLESFLALIANSSSGVERYGVLRAQPAHEHKELIAVYNDDYLLKHKGRLNFIILQKDHALRTEALYMREKYGLQSTEIDALGYLHTKNRLFLIVGETTTRKGELSINAFDDNEHVRSAETRVLEPLKSLFPEHTILYFVMAAYDQLYDRTEGPTRLKREPAKLHARLREHNIPSMFVPTPRAEKNLAAVVGDAYAKIPLVLEMNAQKESKQSK